MNRIFTINNGIQVPDGTIVYPFLNPKDSTSGLSWDLIEGFSIAAGEIAPHSHSKIHVMPLVTQVTLVLCGTLDVQMKDDTASEVYRLHLNPEQAVVTRPGTFFQLINAADVTCRVLYLVSPAYVFEMKDNQVIYDDALVLDEDWQKLRELDWKPSALLERPVTPESREAALKRLEKHSMH